MAGTGRQRTNALNEQQVAEAWVAAWALLYSFVAAKLTNAEDQLAPPQTAAGD